MKALLAFAFVVLAVPAMAHKHYCTRDVHAVTNWGFQLTSQPMPELCMYRGIDDDQRWPEFQDGFFVYIRRTIGNDSAGNTRGVVYRVFVCNRFTVTAPNAVRSTHSRRCIHLDSIGNWRQALVAPWPYEPATSWRHSIAYVLPQHMDAFVRELVYCVASSYYIGRLPFLRNGLLGLGPKNPEAESWATPLDWSCREAENLVLGYQ